MIDLKAVNTSKQLTAPVTEVATSPAGASGRAELDFANEAFDDLLKSLFAPTLPAIDNDSATEARPEATTIEMTDTPTNATATIPVPGWPNAPLNPQLVLTALTGAESEAMTTQDDTDAGLLGPAAFKNRLSAGSASTERNSSIDSGTTNETDTPSPRALPLREPPHIDESLTGNATASSQALQSLLGGLALANTAEAKPLSEVDSATFAPISNADRRDTGATPQALLSGSSSPIEDQTLARHRETGISRLEQTVGTNAWRQELTQRISLMIEKGEQALTLRLSPEHLGPLEVRVAIREGDTSLWFGATHPETRQALEQSLSKLREQFAQAGLSLGQSWISNGSPQQSMPQPMRPAWSELASPSIEPQADIKTEITATKLTLIDTYV